MEHTQRKIKINENPFRNAKRERTHLMLRRNLHTLRTFLAFFWATTVKMEVLPENFVVSVFTFFDKVRCWSHEDEVHERLVEAIDTKYFLPRHTEILENAALLGWCFPLIYLTVMPLQNNLIRWCYQGPSSSPYKMLSNFILFSITWSSLFGPWILLGLIGP